MGTKKKPHTRTGTRAQTALFRTRTGSLRDWVLTHACRLPPLSTISTIAMAHHRCNYDTLTLALALVQQSESNHRRQHASLTDQAVINERRQASY